MPDGSEDPSGEEKDNAPKWDQFDLDLIELFKNLELLHDDDWEAIREVFRTVVGQRVTRELREQLSQRLKWTLTRANEDFDKVSNPEDMLITVCGYPLGDPETNALSFALSNASEKVKYEIAVLRKAFGDWVDDTLWLVRRGEEDWTRTEMDFSLRFARDGSVPFVTLRIFQVTGDRVLEMSLPVESAFRLVRSISSRLSRMPEEVLPDLEAQELDSSLGRAITLLTTLKERLSIGRETSEDA